jgi:hypothetical protein
MDFPDLGKGGMGGIGRVAFGVKRIHLIIEGAVLGIRAEPPSQGINQERPGGMVGVDRQSIAKAGVFRAGSYPVQEEDDRRRNRERKPDGNAGHARL